jgi:alkylated DNA repair dioxygenase AlkB
MTDQLALFETPPALPEGFVYQPDFVTPEEERALMQRIGALEFVPFQFRGFEGRRRVAYFGWRYDFNGGGLGRAEPMPEWLTPLRDRAAAFARLEPTAFEHVLINEYREGAPIGWHRDRPQFDRVVGVSLGSPCVMRLRRRTRDGFERVAVPLAPRSAYLLDGVARSEWEHSIPEQKGHRYSITFRNLR